MPDSGDALTRQWMLLQEIPRAPRSRSTVELHAAMRRHGFEVTPRTTQRDLERLSGIFPITCDEDGRSHRWYWLPDAAVTEFPGMSPEAAIAMLVAGRYRELTSGFVFCVNTCVLAPSEATGLP